jgi:hypothetical protein
MDKVQVDVRKLQLLNERINQTIDALNQVRLTTQQAGIPMGLSHTSPYGIPQNVFGGGQMPYGQNPYGQVPFGQGQFGQQTPFGQVGAMGQGVMPQWGLGHSSFVDPMIARSIALGGLAHASYVRPSEFVLGAIDPWLRQAELARATEANRVWELSQGLGHTTQQQQQVPYGVSPFGVGAQGSPYGMQGSPYGMQGSPYGMQGSPYGIGFGGISGLG